MPLPRALFDAFSLPLPAIIDTPLILIIIIAIAIAITLTIIAFSLFILIFSLFSPFSFSSWHYFHIFTLSLRQPRFRHFTPAASRRQPTATDSRLATRRPHIFS
jgi:hypothetical protein